MLRSGRSIRPFVTLSFSSSKVTRKNEARDMISHAMRNSTPLCEMTTRAMLATRSIEKKP